MAKQPTRKAKPQKQARKAKALSWVPIDEYLKRTRPMGLSIQHDLEPELESGKRKSMRRDIATGIREELQASFWVGHLIDVSIGSVQIYRCKPGDKTNPQRWAFHAHQHDDLERGHDYFVGADLAPVRRKSRTSSGPLLFSEQQMEEAKAFYRRKLDATAQAKPPFRKKQDDPKFWRNQRSAAEHIATEILGLKVGSWQTVKLLVVKPVLSEWKAAQQPIKPRKK
jgi:hypothetical protein